MMRLHRIWIFVVFLTLTASVFAAPTPQEQFLQIYFSLQEADKLEKKGDGSTALARYQEALQKLKDLKTNYPEWEPSIVKYRLNFAQTKVTALQKSVVTVPAAPTPGPGSGSAPADATSSPSSSVPAMPMPAMSPDAPVKTMPTAPTTAMPTPMPVPLTDSNEANALRGRIAALEEELSTTKNKLTSALTEITQLRTRLAAAEKELDVARNTNVEDRVNAMLKENNALKADLADAQTKLKQLQSGDSKVTMAALQEQLSRVQDQLADLQKENQDFRDVNAGMKKQLELAQIKLANVDTQSLQMPDGESVRRENEILRGIITRQLQEQARRDAAKNLANEELANLKVKSDVLKQQIDILSSPLIALAPADLALLKIPLPPAPTAPITPPSGFQAPLVSTNETPAATPETPAPAMPTPNTVKPNAGEDPAPASLTGQNTTPAKPDAGTPKDTQDVTARARIPDDMRDVARQATDLFGQRKYDEAAALYQQMADKYPDSIYAWSNLGVVRFQQQRYPDAEKALQQAIRLNPNDGFSHSVLGIVYYQLGRFDEAIETLSRAIILEPNDARTRNYLGISCSQKGWQEAAEKSLRKAIELDPNYGDAHFNLAVIYATQKPPSTELARREYKSALDLGIPKDAQLESFLTLQIPNGQK